MRYDLVPGAKRKSRWIHFRLLLPVIKSLATFLVVDEHWTIDTSQNTSMRLISC
jgi:hypothetical protein